MPLPPPLQLTLALRDLNQLRRLYLLCLLPPASLPLLQSLLVFLLLLTEVLLSLMLSLLLIL